MCKSSVCVPNSNLRLVLLYCLKEAHGNGGYNSTASREDVDQAGVTGFTSYLRVAEEIT